MGGSTTTYLEAKYFKWPLFFLNGKGPSLGGFHPKMKDTTGSRGSDEFSGSKNVTPPYEPFEPQTFVVEFMQLRSDDKYE